MRFIPALLCSVLLCSCASYQPGSFSYRGDKPNDPVVIAEGSYAKAIHDKIRQSVPSLPDIPSNAETRIKVFVSPTGAVTAAKLIKSSGFPKYDEAVKQAIYKAMPLPVPNDPKLFLNTFDKFSLILGRVDIEKKEIKGQ